MDEPVAMTSALRTAKQRAMPLPLPLSAPVRMTHLPANGSMRNVETKSFILFTGGGDGPYGGVSRSGGRRVKRVDAGRHDQLGRGVQDLVMHDLAGAAGAFGDHVSERQLEAADLLLTA